MPTSWVGVPPAVPFRKIEFCVIVVVGEPDVTSIPAPTLLKITFLLTVFPLPKIRIPGSTRVAPLPVPLPVTVLSVRVYAPELCDVSIPGPCEPTNTLPLTAAVEPLPMFIPPNPGLLIPLPRTSLFWIVQPVDVDSRAMPFPCENPMRLYDRSEEHTSELQSLR